jgi:glc operon protein GlcG
MRLSSILRGTLVWAAVTVAARAQPVASKPTLTLEGAKAVVAACESAAKRLEAAGAIAVVDEGGNLMMVQRLDGTFAAGANISIGKARTAAMFKKPTKAFEDIIKGGRTPMVALNDFTPLQGGVPIIVDGQVVGAVGVSGAHSAQEDEDIAIAGAAALSTDQRGATEPAKAPEPPKTIAVTAAASATPEAKEAVMHFEKSAVDSSFARGVPLFDRPELPYAVHTSRRDAPGMAEVHQTETDVIYVVQGEATFVTGGEIIGGKKSGPHEVRGGSIAGGDERRIACGDVVIVPKGTPHWFKEVTPPVLYYLIKVRG